MIARRPGQFLAERVNRKFRIGLLLIGAFIAVDLISLSWHPLLIVTLMVGLVVWRLVENGGRYDFDNDRKGLAGELIVGQALESLSSRGVLAVHDVNLGWGNVDHVAISPHGVFAIEVKHLSGDRFYPKDGHLMRGKWLEDRYATQASKGARKVRDVLRASGLDLWVDALLVSTKAEVWRGGFEVSRLRVLPPDRLTSELFRGPEKLTTEQMGRAHYALLAADRSPEPRGSRLWQGAVLRRHRAEA